MNQTCPEPEVVAIDARTERAKRTRFWNRAIAVSQIVGGGMGLSLVASSQVAADGIFIMLTAGAFASTFSCGLLLWRGSRRGLALSTLIQGLQIVQIGVPGLSYLFVTGLALRIIGFSTGGHTHLSINAGCFSAMYIWLGSRAAGQAPTYFGPSDSIILGVNVAAAAAFVFLVRQLMETPPPAPN